MRRSLPRSCFLIIASTWEAWLLRASERLNPIVVKEARQALKSRQFTITFTLVLAACWLWSMLKLALLGPSAYYLSDGRELFFGYYIILSFATLVIVPFGAFRSLTSEREDRTYELLSITTLRPRQIVSGKLAAAVLQMLVYLSAVSPCLAFTYLLRGIDIPTIVIIVAYTVVADIGIDIGVALSPVWTISRHRGCLARLAVPGMTPAPLAVLAQGDAIRIVALGLLGLVVPALAILAREGHCDPDVSAGHERRAPRVVGS